MLEPDRDQIEVFADAIFRHAGTQGFVTVRSFLEDEDRVVNDCSPRCSAQAGSGFLSTFVKTMLVGRRRTPKPVVFCPPLAVFSSKDHAREQDLLEGLALAVELDEHPQQARTTLENLLGPATIVVRSGGRWLDAGHPEDKLHLHWRLKMPASNT